jgi:hypothetical protein
MIKPTQFLHECIWHHVLVYRNMKSGENMIGLAIYKVVIGHPDR